MKKQRKHYAPEEKVAILRRHLVEGVPISDNDVRLNSGIVYITPKDMLAGHQQEIQADRDRKLEAAREQRKNRRPRAARRIQRITSGWPTNQALCQSSANDYSEV
jgi:hypothetical protein